MATMTNITFLDLLKECQRIRIPEIQRDYAQGRANEKAKKVREGFISSLLPVFAGAEDEVPLDFIYGYRRDNGRDKAFEPLDGQQRLTTLFLIHWLFCPVGCNDLIDMESGGKRSRFQYATRTSSEQFCDALVNHPALELVECWHRLAESQSEPSRDAEDSKRESEAPVLFSKFLSGLSWFEWRWRYDPTVMSMLNTMDTVLSSLDENGILYRDVHYENLKRIVFHRLDLNENLFAERNSRDPGFKLGDELYVKMNSRGKELSEFDKLKSTLEEELQYQKEEGRVDDRIEAEWRTAMDGIWADYFWQSFHSSDDLASTPDASAVSEVVSSVEEPFRRFLIRVVAFSLLESMDVAWSSDRSIPDSWKGLKDKCESTDDEVLASVVDAYSSMIRLVRQAGGDSGTAFPRLDFRGILANLGKIFCQNPDGKVVDITAIACPQLRWDPSDSCSSMLQDFIVQSPSRDRRLECSAVLSFVQNLDTTDLSQNEAMRDDLCDWLRFARNCILPRNTYQRVGKPSEEAIVRRFLRTQIRTFADRAKADSTLSMRQFIEAMEYRYGDGVEQGNIEEERTKAKLKFDPAWKKLLDDTEANPYLWGQLRALLDWSKDTTGTPDMTIFERYAQRICSIFPVKNAETQDKFWKALLCLDDYRMKYGENKKTLVTFDYDRDASWKQYMRKGPEPGSFAAPILKQFIDIWLETEYASLDFVSFLDRLLSERAPAVKDWRRYVLGVHGLSTEFCPSMGFLVDDNGLDADGHKWFFPKKQIGESRRSWELVCAYLSCRECADGVKSVLTDSLDPDSHKKNSVEFLRNENTFIASVQAIAGGRYLFRHTPDSPGVEMDGDTAVQRIEEEGLVI